MSLWQCLSIQRNSISIACYRMDRHDIERPRESDPNFIPQKLKLASSGNENVNHFLALPLFLKWHGFKANVFVILKANFKVRFYYTACFFSPPTDQLNMSRLSLCVDLISIFETSSSKLRYINDTSIQCSYHLVHNFVVEINEFIL